MNKYIYPTKKNMFIAFVLAQAWPIIQGAITGYNWVLWIGFEMVILGMLAVWEHKPTRELDERELKITNKWRARVMNSMWYCGLFPMTVLCFKPDIWGWWVYIMFSVPMFIVFSVMSFLMKRELGGFFFMPEDQTTAN